ncbi:hypothetical protein [Pseudoalteromonas phenolica]|nr:hypothetical protein [Pseudoalteromonas phenolica]RXF00540.1 hypothetical protein D9981_09485 [Pseudoalteromonas phenolica O-BC30]
MEISEFRRVMFGLAREVDASICDVLVPDVVPNFIACNLRASEFSIYVLCNEQSEWAFVSDYDPTNQKLNFVDNEVISSILSNSFSIRVASVEELGSPFVARDKMLESDIKYWKPQTMGEALFNWWD